MKKLLLVMSFISIALSYSSLSQADDDDWDERSYYSRPQINNYYPPQQGYNYYPQRNYYPPQPQYYGYYQGPYNSGYGNFYGYRGGNRYGHSRYRHFRCNRDDDD